MKLTWHVPNFVDADEETAEFFSLEELYALPPVKMNTETKGFVRWSFSDPYLMVEFEDETFWVIARLDKDARKYLKALLPKWEMPLRRQVELINRQLPTCYIVESTATVRQIAEARVAGEGIELRFEGEAVWTPVERNPHLAQGMRDQWERTYRLVAEADANPTITETKVYRRINGVMQEVSQ